MGSTRLRVVTATMAAMVLVGSMAAGVAAKQPSGKHAAEHAVLDLLGAATPDMQFSVFGSTGSAISATQNRGPMFTINRPTILTEIGAFLNNCASIIGGVPLCPGAQAISVEIRPDLGGRPDPNVVLARLRLSHDDDPLVVRYEFVRTRIHLKAGTYYAMFAPSVPDDEGFLLESASELAGYQADVGIYGVLDPADAEATSGTEIGPQAVRILAAGKDHDEDGSTGLLAPEEAAADVPVEDVAFDAGPTAFE